MEPEVHSVQKYPRIRAVSVLLPQIRIIRDASKEVEVTGDWRELHNEELHNLYSSPNIIRMMKSGTMFTRALHWSIS
jgi:hypothetical protein